MIISHSHLDRHLGHYCYPWFRILGPFAHPLTTIHIHQPPLSCIRLLLIPTPPRFLALLLSFLELLHLTLVVPICFDWQNMWLNCWYMPFFPIIFYLVMFLVSFGRSSQGQKATLWVGFPFFILNKTLCIAFGAFILFIPFFISIRLSYIT